MSITVPVAASVIKNLRFEDYGDYPAATLSASDTTLSGSAPTQPSNPTQQPSTQAIPTQPSTSAPPATYDPSKLLRGDADADNEVSVLDATRIQRTLVDLDTIDKAHEPCADVDGDNDIAIVDATAIQRYLAGIANPYHINEYISGSQPATEDPATEYTFTEPVDEDPTDEAIYDFTPKPLSTDYVAVIYCEAFGTDDTSRNKEAKFDKATGTLTFDFPDASYVFARRVQGGIQYCTDGWAGFVNPVTLVNEHSTTQFNKLYIPAGTHTLYLYENSDDTLTLGYADGSVPTSPTSTSVTPTSPDVPVTGNDITFTPGDASQASPQWYAWVWSGSEEGKWIAGESSGSNIVFPGAGAYSKIIILRMPAGATAPDWKTCWNRTGEISITTNHLVFTGYGSDNYFNAEFR